MQQIETPYFNFFVCYLCRHAVPIEEGNITPNLPKKYVCKTCMQSSFPVAASFKVVEGTTKRRKTRLGLKKYFTIPKAP